jgi:hypothetical protein
MLTFFDAKITKSSGVVQGRCKARKFFWHNTVTYDDGSTDTADLTQKCKRKKRHKHHG